MKISRLGEKTCGLLVVDLQEKFASIIENWEETVGAAIRLVRFFRLIQAPILVTEQYPKGLGPTVLEIRNELEDGGSSAVAKTTFSSCAAAECKKAIQSFSASQWVVCGIEAHVCIQQTTFDLLEMGREVFLAADAISAQKTIDRKMALNRMKSAGATLSTSESLIFEALGDSKHPLFKQAQALVRAKE